MKPKLGGVYSFPASCLSQAELMTSRNDLHFESRGGSKYGFGESQTVDLLEEDDETGLISVPRRYAYERMPGKCRKGVENCLSEGSPVDFVFNEEKQSTRPDLKRRQDNLIAKFMEELQAQTTPYQGGLLSASCGLGKTVMASKMMSLFQRTTLVLVHKEFLMEQWLERMTEFLNISADDVGFVRGNKCAFEGKKVVMAMIQSLMNSDKYPEEFFQWPGVVISDESLPYDAHVCTSDGDLPIGEIVREKIPVLVKAYDLKRKCFDWKRIVQYHEHRPKSPMLEFVLSDGRIFRCTENHEVLSDHGFTTAGSLCAGDNLYLDCCASMQHNNSRKSVEELHDAQLSRRDNVGGLESSAKQEWEESSSSCCAFLGAERSSSSQVCNVEGLVRNPPKRGCEQGLQERRESDEVLYPDACRVRRCLERVLSKRGKDRSEVSSRRPRRRSDCLVSDGRWITCQQEICVQHTQFFQSGREEACPKVFSTRVSSESVEDRQGTHSFCGSRGKQKARQGCGEIYNSNITIQDRPSITTQTPRMPLRCLRCQDYAEGVRPGGREVLRTTAMSEGSQASERWEKGDTGCVGGDASKSTVRRVRSSFRGGQNSSEKSVPGGVLCGDGAAESIRALQIKEVRRVLTPQLVYDLEIEDHHNFVCDGFVVHNCHRMSAPCFQSVIPLFPAKTRVGLSATPRRADGLQAVFEWHLGLVLAKMKGTEVTPKIYQMPFEVWLPEDLYMVRNKKTGDVKKIFLSKLTNILVELTKRNVWFLREIAKAFRAGRKVMLLSDRREHLEVLKVALNAKDPQITVGLYMGGMKKKDRERSATCDVILGTYAMAKEGLDIPEIDTLYLATPKSDIEQSVGRALRPHPDKKVPVIVDLVDSLPICMDFAQKRLKQYKQLGYTVVKSIDD